MNPWRSLNFRAGLLSLLLLLVLLVVFAVFLAKAIPTGFVPDEDNGYFLAKCSSSEGSSMSVSVMNGITLQRQPACSVCGPRGQAKLGGRPTNTPP